jgi:C4-dicarboxylate transporter, DctQ subunit
MKTSAALNHAFDRLVDLMGYATIGLLIFSWGSVCAEVVCRYFLRQPIIWVVEVSEYVMVHITFIGSAWLLKREGHVRVDVVTSHLDPKVRTLLLMITSTICTFMFLVLTWYAAVATWGAYRDHLVVPKQLGMPKYLVMVVIPFGCLMLAVQFMKRTKGAMSAWRSSKT